MTTLTIKIPAKGRKTLTDLVEQLGGEVVNFHQEKVNKTAKKQQILNDIEESAKWVKLHQDGKVQAKTIEQLLNEL